MDGIVRNYSVNGRKVKIVWRDPTNEELNEYANSVSALLKSEAPNDAFVALNVVYFDKLAEKIEGKTKESFFPIQKSATLDASQIMRTSEVLEKN